MVEHVSIADADRHEVKHASTGVLNQALLSNGDGTTRFSFASYNDLVDRPSAAGYRAVLAGSSTAATQNPTAVDTALQVEFGPAVATTNASLASNGTLTFNVAGEYQITVFLQFGRTTGAGSAIILSRVLLSGTQSLATNVLKLGDQDAIVPYSFTVNVTVAAGATMQVQIMRDSAGINNGGLTRLIPVVGAWVTGATATISVTKFTGLV